MKKGVICTVAGALAIIAAGQAHALILPAKSEPQAIRQEISKQNLAQTACLVIANLACEASSTTLGSNCDLLTGGVTNGADAKGKYVEAIAKCDSKYNFMKKAKTLTPAQAYQAIGCPGDAVPNCTSPGVPAGCQDGNQNFANMGAYQTSANTTIKSQLNLLSLIVGSSVDVDPSTPGNQPCLDEKCLASASSGLSKYAQALQKCIIACENDYAAKKGNGGPNDLTVCAVDATGITGAPGSDPAFDACVDKAWASATKKPLPLAGLAGTVGSLLGNAAQTLYNAPSNCP